MNQREKEIYPYFWKKFHILIKTSPFCQRLIIIQHLQLLNSKSASPSFETLIYVIQFQ